MYSPPRNQPLNQVIWLHRDQLTANDYNPNKVAPPEMELLKISIMEDGWTQPIVINQSKEIVDGFHRWTVSGQIEVYALTDGHVPTVTISPKSEHGQQMATIRHNRARGTHTVLDMSKIVARMIDEGLRHEQIMKLLQMEREEVIRLAFRAGIPKSAVLEGKGFSQAWVPE